MMIGRRQFVNMVAENLKGDVYSVHRLNVSEHLFYPSTAEAEAARPAALSRLGALPPPATSFHSAPPLRRRGQLFALVSPRSSESRILWSNWTEHTTIYDTESRSTYEMPNLSYKGCDPITISIGRPDAPEEDLYVMSAGRAASSDFEVFRFGRPSHSKVNLFPNPPQKWLLESLPPPPLPEAALICSHAVLHDGRTICVTAGAGPYGAVGTYLFDTVEREWSQAPDGWNLPFVGGAEYVPDLKLWLGLVATGNDGHPHLCASDLSASINELPTLKHQWEVVETPEEWVATMVRLINLGEGRFCIFKLIHDHIPYKEGYDDYFSYHGNLRRWLALLTGVEISRSSPEHGLRMVPHKSLSYIFNMDMIKCVL